MEARRLYWLGDRHKAALEARLREALGDWNSAWWAGGHAPYQDAALSMVPADQSEDAVGRWIPVGTSERIVVWVHVPEGLNSWLNALLENAGATIPNKAWARLASRVLLDLLSRLSRQPNGATSLLPEALPPKSLFEKASGAALIEIKGASDMSLLLPLSTVEEIVGVLPAAPRPRLVRSEKSFDSEVVPIQVQIEVSGGLTVEQLRSLSVGDVVLLEQPLGAEWTVLNSSGASIGCCRPGRSGQHFAVQLLPPSRNA